MDTIMSRQQIATVHLRPSVRALDRAEGVLMALRRCSCQDAFDELLEAARRQHVPVFAIALALVALVDGTDLSNHDPVATAAADRQWGDLLGRRKDQLTL
ncbi:ANTAR domain-containing protein [Mycolicibacterium llatzerense]|uniref:ANTAR domain-containing protein n=1 Tax=Mycolicibacterium llatzerense TaxID=280871 RepID=UPI0021B4E024|nr:ANTAR domain-containing protein [Mycolicibacterium llatzerense]